MAENIVYADLKLPESAPARLQQVSDGQVASESPYAELKVKPQGTNDARGHASSGKSCGFRNRVAVLVAVVVVIIFLLVLVGCLIHKYHPTASSQQDSTTSSLTRSQDLTTSSPSNGKEKGCPRYWEKHGRKCYFFFPNLRNNWNGSRKQCTVMGSDLVIIANKEELHYLLGKSRHNYYFLGLRYSQRDQKWKWINNVEHDPAMFDLTGRYQDYLCSVIGYNEVHSAPCDGDETTQNMCEKPATIS